MSNAANAFGRMAILATVVVAALLLVGCGDSDSGTSASRATDATTTTDRQTDDGAEARGAPKSGESNATKGDGSADSGNAPDQSQGAGSGAAEPEQDQSDGQSSGPPDSAGVEVTGTKEFIAAADAICARRGHEIVTALTDRLRGDLQALSRAGVAEDLVNELWTPKLEQEIAELDALKGPESVEARLDDVIDGIEGVMAEAQSDPQAFALKSHAFGEPEQLAKKYGFESCGAVR